jgi:hypothetical protein
MGTEFVAVDPLGIAVMTPGMLGRRLGLMAALVTVVTVVSGCDGSLTVTGELSETGCEMSLWTMAGPIWQEPRPTLRRTATVGSEIDVRWTVTGPVSPHWIQVACPGGGTFRSHDFQAGASGARVDLGRVPLVRASSPGQSPR